jgi:hypothetical protein
VFTDQILCPWCARILDRLLQEERIEAGLKKARADYRRLVRRVAAVEPTA